jgi:opacity protein-like surface antigen
MKKSWIGWSAVFGAALLGSKAVYSQQLITKPEWLPTLALGFSESYDDNIYGVSGLGLQPKSSWFSTFSPRVGFDFAPLLGSGSAVTALTLAYSPDLVRFHDAPQENYDAEKFTTGIKGRVGKFSFALDNSFLYVDGSKIAPTYALNQLSGAAGNQFDKYRNNFAYAAARERRNQIQDRANVTLGYDMGKFYFKPTASLIDYDLNTTWHNTSKAPYLGYLNFVGRSDVNGGADVGYRVVPNLALTLGYRYGSQYQQSFPTTISSDSHFASSTYNRALAGIDGRLWHWLEIKLQGGPDFRDYNVSAPVPNHHPTKYYGEASILATLSQNQYLTFNYKQWNWVSSTGYVPIWDSTYSLNYHWNPTPKLGFDLTAKIQENDYTGGNDKVGNQPSVRADRLYSLSPGVSYAFTPQLTASLSYTYSAGNNELTTIPTADHGAYRNYVENIVSLGLQYKF